jgi:hypothetical protein
LREITSLREFFSKIGPTELTWGIRVSSCVALAIFGAANAWRFSRNLIRGVVRAGLVEGTHILITPFDVVVFASKVFHAVNVDDVGYGEDCGSNIISAQEAYHINERECLGGRFDMSALRKPVVIEGDKVLI